MKKLALIIAAAALVSACGTTKPRGTVIPQADNTYQTIAPGGSENAALKAALASAEWECKERNMRHIVLDKQTEYKGVVSQESNKMIDTAAGIFAAASGRFVPTLSGNDDYQVTLKFSCQQ
jgi:cytochrome oxidase Cu insertion factor (SCO1/SenC/PrrC family)